MSQELALKFSTADLEQLLGILPTEDVLEIIYIKIIKAASAKDIDSLAE